MRFALPKPGWLAAGVAAGQLLCSALPADERTNAAAPRRDPSAALLPPPLPPPGPRKSPVDLFRELLAMDAKDRKQYLTNRSPENQKLILAKVREYQSLKPDQRELRLRVTELRWYLLPLMSTAATNRAERLAAVPEDYRKLVVDRLREWDILPPKVRKELLEHEPAIRSYLELQAGQPPPPPTPKLSEARRARLEQGIAPIAEMSEEQRQRLTAQFNQFFDLRPAEKAKALNTLSEPERRQIEKTLHSFGNLPPDKRAQCIRSFEKFASLSLPERQQFLKNADRWKLMTPNQRQTWRELVEKVPIMPPSLSSPPPRPPTPPAPRRAPALAVTNSQ